ncbi:MAG: hypothetical protein CVU63_13470, partial [Deltaproteobacteria bacterium HGW-Deltaproteobacteria-20]
MELRILTDPFDDARDALDGGRRIPDGGVEHFELTPHLSAPSMRLIVRTAPSFPGKVEVAMNGEHIGNLALEPSARWVEL